MTESNAETAFTREVATAGANALTIFGRETNSEPKARAKIIGDLDGEVIP